MILPDTSAPRAVVLFLLLFSFSACSGAHRQACTITAHDAISLQHKSVENQQRIEALALDLARLHGLSSQPEAIEVAKTAITYSNYLAVEYRLAGSPYFHNMLVRIGLKERGLCYHWTEDLIKRLKRLHLKTYQLHWGVAHRGSELREHNSVVITARDRDFNTGIVLDPWRSSGCLYWARIPDDRYPWQARQPHE